MNSPEFISFTYEKLQDRQVFERPTAEGGAPYSNSLTWNSFHFLKDRQTSLLRGRRGRIHDACGDNRSRGLDSDSNSSSDPNSDMDSNSDSDSN